MRTLTLNLSYAATDLEEVQTAQLNGRIVPVSIRQLTAQELTARLITFAINQACRGGMDKATAGVWLPIKRLISIPSDGAVELTDEQFAFLASAVNACRYAVAAIEAASLLWVELEREQNAKTNSP